MSIKIILFIYIGFLFFNISFAADNYYQDYIRNEINLITDSEIDNYNLKHREELVTTGCIAKSITGAGILLFSQDPSNDYLFKNKNLEITIGELLINRKHYLESLNSLSLIQQDKLNFINKLIPTIDESILNAKIYKILNHTSIFADDFNQYLLYLLVQKIINVFPENERDLLMLNGIQFLSINNTKQKETKYSNMGYMYIIKIMSLMTDRENFYYEIKERIFKPLNLENNFIPVYTLTQEELKKLFRNQNYYEKVNNKFIKINIYDLMYNDMDTLNGGLISNIESAILATREISKMYFGFPNRLTKNSDKISNFFFKYKTIYDNSELYSLGTYINISDNKITLRMSGNVFGKETGIKFSLNRIVDYRDISLKNYVYNKDNYNNIIYTSLNLVTSNIYLKTVFFDYFLIIYNKKPTYYNNQLFKDILVKSIFVVAHHNDTVDFDKIEWLINYNPKKLIKELQNESDRIILDLQITKEEKEGLKKEFKVYFDELEKFLTDKYKLNT